MNFYQKFTAELVVDIAVALLVQSVVNQVLDYVELVWFVEPSERLKLRVTVKPWARENGQFTCGLQPDWTAIGEYSLTECEILKKQNLQSIFYGIE